MFVNTVTASYFTFRGNVNAASVNTDDTLWLFSLGVSKQVDTMFFWFSVNIMSFMHYGFI